MKMTNLKKTKMLNKIFFLGTCLVLIPASYNYAADLFAKVKTEAQAYKELEAALNKMMDDVYGREDLFSNPAKNISVPAKLALTKFIDTYLDPEFHDTLMKDAVNLNQLESQLRGVIYSVSNKLGSAQSFTQDIAKLKVIFDKTDPKTLKNKYPDQSFGLSRDVRNSSQQLLIAYSTKMNAVAQKAKVQLEQLQSAAQSEGGDASKPTAEQKKPGAKQGAKSAAKKPAPKVVAKKSTGKPQRPVAKPVEKPKVEPVEEPEEEAPEAQEEKAAGDENEAGESEAPAEEEKAEASVEESEAPAEEDNAETPVAEDKTGESEPEESSAEQKDAEEESTKKEEDENKESEEENSDE